MRKKKEKKFTFVCWKWKGPSGYRSRFSDVHVNTLYNMISRHYKKPFELVCITDNPYGINDKVRIIKLWDDHKNIPSPYGIMNPSCYRRLKMFSDEAKEIIAPRFLSIDLDVIITGDLTPIVQREEEFVAFGDTHKTTYYNGGLILLTAGSRKQVWEKFDPIESPKKAKEAMQYGSDQAWLGFCLGPNEAKFSTKDGIYSWRIHLDSNRGRLPADAKIVLFHGQIDPDSSTAQKYEWVQKHYR